MLEIRESQIEDIFATQLDEVRNILSIDENISLIDRQKKLRSGRLDLLFISASFLHLLELKAVKSKAEFCEQLINYRNDLLELQKVPKLPIKSYLVCPAFIDSHKQYCLQHDIIPIKFSPFELLKNYYFKVKAVSSLITLKPSHGVWNLHLFNPILYSIKKESTVDELSTITGKSKSTVSSYIKLSSELGLTQLESKIKLTGLGKEYIKARDEQTNRLSDSQSELLKNFILKNPFSSPSVYGIYTVAESIFLLSKNFYPVPFIEGYNFFRYLCGKQSEWADKAAKDAFIMYSNYAVNLGLLAKIEKNCYMTPSGIKFILLLELNKSILFVNSI